MRSIEYWRSRYASGGGSGIGSRDFGLAFKVGWLNSFFTTHGVKSVLDWGCGDQQVGTRLEVADYLGLDVADHPWQNQRLTQLLCGFDGTLPANVPVLDAGLVLDVFYHILEGEEDYLRGFMRNVGEHAMDWVIVYANAEGWKPDVSPASHICWRDWWRIWAEECPEWELRWQQDRTFSEWGSEMVFHVYGRRGQ